jgi:hypothetical protein
VLPHLAANDVTMICVSRAPLEKLRAYRERMGWSFSWASSYGSDFNFDFGVSACEEAPQAVALLLAAVRVLALSLDEASGKIRTGPPDDGDSPDAALGLWAGELPLATTWQQPISDPALPPGIPVPAHIRSRAGAPGPGPGPGPRPSHWQFMIVRRDRPRRRDW